MSHSIKLAIGIVLMVLFMWIVKNKNIIFNPTVEVGQVWVYCDRDTGNPFEEVECKTKEVLRVANGHVEYKSESGFIWSMEMYLFLHGDVSLISEKEQ